MADVPERPAFDAAALDDTALAAEYTRIQTRGAELAAQETLSEEESAELTELASRSDAVATETAAREARAAELAAARAQFAPVEPAPEPAPVVEPSAIQTSTDPAPVPVAVPSVADLNNQPPVAPALPSARGASITAFVSADGAGFTGKRSGEMFDGMTEISRALIASRQQYGRVTGGSGARHAIAQFRRDRGVELTTTGRKEDDQKILQYARNERRLHGGSLAKQWQHNIDQGTSLTAAAGWCAPSENLYDICRLWGTNVGVLDLPTITATRGGFNYTDEPSFADIYANAVAVGGGSNFLTEAQVIADTAKTCSEVPCPTFENRRLDVLALCIRVSLLQAAGYPELVDTWVDGLMEANAQEMNRIIIADMIARAGAATTVTPVDPDGDSFTSALLAAVELAAVDIRYREGMPLTATVEILLPAWVVAQIRADLSRRNGVNLLQVSDSEIASLFSVRNVRVQFVRGWQDGLITGGALAPTFPGGDAATPFMLTLPQTVSFLAYPAGSVAVARQDVITLTNVYDAASLATNEFTRLFAEEGFAPIYPCGGLRQYTVAGCVGGITGAAEINCTDAA